MFAVTPEPGVSKIPFTTLLASEPAPTQRFDAAVGLASGLTHIAIIVLLVWLFPAPVSRFGVAGEPYATAVTPEEYWAAPNLAAPAPGAALKRPPRSRLRAPARYANAMAHFPLPDLSHLAQPLLSTTASEWIERAKDDLQKVADDLVTSRGLAAQGPSDERLEAAGAPYTMDQLKLGPTATDFTIAPELLNRSEIVELLNQRYPRAMRELGRGGLTTLWLLIDEDGKMRKAIVHQSSGQDALDAAALDAVAIMRFSPAQNNGHNTAVWVQLPVRFQVAGVL